MPVSRGSCCRSRIPGTCSAPTASATTRSSSGRSRRATFRADAAPATRGDGQGGRQVLASSESPSMFIHASPDRVRPTGPSKIASLVAAATSIATSTKQLQRPRQNRIKTHTHRILAQYVGDNAPMWMTRHTTWGSHHGHPGSRGSTTHLLRALAEPETVPDAGNSDDLFSLLRSMGQRQRHWATLVVLSAAKDRIGFLGYLPAAWFTPANRTTIEALLRAELSADEVTGGLAVLGDDIAITGWTITTRDGRPVAFAGRTTVERLQQSIDRAVKGWAEVFSEAAATHRLSDKMRRHYRTALPRDYKHDRGIADCLRDIGRLESLAVNAIDVVLEYSCDSRTNGQSALLIYAAGHRIRLSRVLPMLHTFGVDVIDERPYAITRTDGVACWIYRFAISMPDGSRCDATRYDRFTDAFTRAWRGDIEAANLNALVVETSLDWRQINALRGYTRLLRQSGIAYSPERIETVLRENPVITTNLVGLFEAPDPRLSEAGDGAHHPAARRGGQ